MSVEKIKEGDGPVPETSTYVNDGAKGGRETVVDVIKEMVTDLRKDGKSQRSMLARSRDVVRQKSPRLKEAARYSTDDVRMWVNQGGPWRSFLITVTGLIALVGLTGVAAFLVFFIVATANMVVLALLGSVAAVGACVSIFFAAIIAVYIGALSVAVFVISTIALLSIFAIATAAGWIAFWWAVWSGLKKGLDIVRAQTRLYLAPNLQAVETKGQTMYAAIDAKPRTFTSL